MPLCRVWPREGFCAIEFICAGAGNSIILYVFNDFVSFASSPARLILTEAYSFIGVDVFCFVPCNRMYICTPLAVES